MDLLAGLSAFLAIPALLLALTYGLLFFLGRGQRYGPLNDIASAAVLLLLILPAIALKDLVGADPAWFGIVTWVAVAGMVVAAVGQVALVLGAISLNTSFVTGGVGFLPVVVWFAAFTFLSLRDGTPPPEVGWSMLVGLVPIAALVAFFRLSLRPQLVLATVACIGMAASFLFLGLKLVSE
jgi:hypothetical protein